MMLILNRLQRHCRLDYEYGMRSLALALLVALPILGSAQENPSFQVIGYYAEHNTSGNFSIKQIDTSGAAALLTQLDYAFARVAHNHCEVPNPDVELNRAYSAAESVDSTADTAAPNQLRGSFHQLQELKRKHPRLKIMISFGGWGNSEGFSDAAEPQNLKEFVRSCVDTFIKGNFAPGIHAPGVFDGIDVDWEYPVDGGMIPGRPEDKKNMTLLAAEFRRQLDAVRPGLLLTAAIPAGAEDYTHYDLKAISQYFDYLSLMAYDLHWKRREDYQPAQRAVSRSGRQIKASARHPLRRPRCDGLPARRSTRAQTDFRSSVLWQRLDRSCAHQSWTLSTGERPVEAALGISRPEDSAANGRHTV